MVYFVTGKMNDGKTTRLIDLYNQSGKGEGFALIKVMKDSKVHSYKARQLSTKEERQLILRDCWLREDFDEVCRIGPYCFSATSLQWVEATIKKAVSEGVQKIYLDEVGVLELRGQGYSELLTYLLQHEVDLYLTVREDLLDKVVSCFKITNHKKI